MLINDKVVVITGAGRVNGVGAATAKLLAKQGAHLIINCLKNKEQVELVANECKKEGASVEIFLGDVSKASVCHELAAFVKSKWGRTDILVNCVGTTKSASYEKLEQLNEEDFSRLFSVNATAAYLLAQAFQELLKASGDATIVNVSSAVGITGRGSSIAYAAAKGAENTITLALAQALSPEVRVNAVCPSFIDSSWWEESFSGKEDKYHGLVASMKANNLLGRVLKPVDVATTILYIIQNPIMTGELIRLDAGAHIGKANPRN